MKKLIMIVALGASVLATPAFAQSFTPGFGTGNVLPFSYGPTISQNGAIADRSGRNLYDMVPSTQASTDSNAPATTGGGSEGYNALVMQH
jgi:hypothetical protein